MPTFDISDERDFLRQMGMHFLGELQRDAEDQTAPESLKCDWQIVATWLGTADGRLSPSKQDVLQRGWEAYLAIGLAPSLKLQPAFDHFSQQVIVDKKDKPPSDVMRVFDRLLATDDDIRLKRAADFEAERKRFAPLFEKYHSQKLGWWRARSKATRAWVFASVVWMLAVLLYALIFDPFDTGGFDYLRKDEVLRLVAIAALPALGAALYQAYKKFVR